MINLIRSNLKTLLIIALTATIFACLLFYFYNEKTSFIHLNFSQLINGHTLLALLSLYIIFIVSTKCFLNSYWIRYKRNYTIKKPPLILIDQLIVFTNIFFILLIYFSYLKDPHYFDGLYSTTHIYNYYMGMIIITLLAIVPTYYQNKKGEAPNEIPAELGFSLYSDHPITHHKEDRLGRSHFVDNFHREIVESNITGSFSYGLYGKWGEGKTSLVNLLKNKFETENANEYIFIHFKPWFFDNEKAILLAFYDKLEEEINKKFIFPNLAKYIYKYESMILLALKETTGFKMPIIIEKESIGQIRNKLSFYLNRTQRKIIVVIDDIDRLQPKEIVQIFKLVHLHANFSNIVFILCLDESTLKNPKLKDLITDSDYVDKIVQKPIRLPKIDQEELNAYILYSESSLTKIINDHGEKLVINGNIKEDKLIINNEKKTTYRLSCIDLLLLDQFKKKVIPIDDILNFDKEFISDYRNMQRFILTLRSSKRFINSLVTSLPAIISEVNIRDFTVLEFLKVFFPVIYDDIFENYWFYIDSRKAGENNFNYMHSLSEDKKFEMTKEHIEKLLKKNGDLPSTDTEYLIQILKDLFPNIGSAFDGHNYHAIDNAPRMSKRIFSNSFLKYFILQNISGELSDKLLEAMIEEWNNSTSAKNAIRPIFSDKPALDKILDKLSSQGFYKKIHPSKVNDFVRTCYENVSKFKDDQNASRTIANLLVTIINSHIANTPSLKALVTEIIENVDDIYFAFTFFSFCKNGNNGYLIRTVCGTKCLSKLLLKRMGIYYISENNSIFAEYKDNHKKQVLLNFMLTEATKKNIVLKYLYQQIENDQENFIDFLKINSTPIVSFSGDKDWEITFEIDTLAKKYDINLLKKIATKFNSSYTDINSKEIITTFCSKLGSYLVDIHITPENK